MSARARAQSSLVTLGDLILEVAVVPTRPVEQGTDVPGTLRLRRGGSAANVAVAFAALGGSAAFIGAVSPDGGGKRLVESMRRSGVRVHGVRSSGRTARLLVMLTPDGERSFVTDRGVADQVLASDIREGWFSGVGGLHVPGYSLYHDPLRSGATEAIRVARAGGWLVSVDLSSTVPMLAFGRDRAWKLLHELRPDVLFANASEADALTRGGDPARLLELATIAVVKEGAGGCRILRRGPGAGSGAGVGLIERQAVATAPLSAPDTTGAGDAFAAGFLFVLLSRWVRNGGLREAGAFSSAELRRAALSGHRSAATLLRSERPELAL